ncbi:LacI family DNA-binding transcriptional regulator [Schleiferilactobacillus harbinensis]|uniref:LacI family DNA-binding transcriptional regulator n=1 Tax=Schleiferilactobacillus harbinensis TaxID=304207 RepID=UPI000A6C3403|nr:LacI family DNA-binding transcriptional regulator [Schleiferilactobacillus harbinensis]
MKVTIKDIAAATGLSTASVSRILNQRGRYSAASAKRVHDAAADLGYFKNRSAADLASQRNHTIGVINYPAEQTPMIKSFRASWQRPTGWRWM